MFAGILLLVVFVDCIVTWFLLARVKGYRSEVEVMEENNKAMADALRAAAVAMGGAPSPAVLPAVASDMENDALLEDAKGVIANASPEDIAHARAILDQLGL